MTTKLPLAVWIEALASNALEGNRWAAETLELQKTNPVEFLSRIAQLEIVKKGQVA